MIALQTLDPMSRNSEYAYGFQSYMVIIILALKNFLDISCHDAYYHSNVVTSPDHCIPSSKHNVHVISTIAETNIQFAQIFTMLHMYPNAKRLFGYTVSTIQYSF